MSTQYKKLLKDVLEHGVRKTDRTGVGTISMFGYQCRFDLKEGFPIVTEKKTMFRNAIVELIWMIGGWMEDPAYEGIQRTNIKFLLDNGCKIWTEWPYKAYVKAVEKENQENHESAERWRRQGKLVKHSLIPILTQKEYEERIMSDKDFAIKFGDLGPVYQKQWRDFEGKKEHVDQLQTMINRLKSNPDDRRNLSSYWNPTELNEMLLPPCHLLHQVWTRELTLEERTEIFKQTMDEELVYRTLFEFSTHDGFDKHFIPKRAISLQMYQRSSDCFLGVPFDWVWYAAFTHILASLTNMVPDEFIWVSGDTHLYLNSLEQTQKVLDATSYPYPKLNIKRKVDRIEDFKIDDFELIDYQHGPYLKVEVAV